MKIRFVSFSRFLRNRRTRRHAGAALVCCSALLTPAICGDGSEQGIPARSALTQPATLKLPAASANAPSTLPASLTNVTSAQLNGDLVVSVVTDSPVPKTRRFQLSDPPRLVVDLVNVHNNAPFFDLRINRMGVKKVRVRQFQSTEPKIVRLVFELDETHGTHEIRTEGESLQIVFHAPDQPAGRPAPEPPASHVPPAAAPAPQTAAKPALIQPRENAGQVQKPASMTDAGATRRPAPEPPAPHVPPAAAPAPQTAAKPALIQPRENAGQVQKPASMTDGGAKPQPSSRQNLSVPAARLPEARSVTDPAVESKARPTAAAATPPVQQRQSAAPPKPSEKKSSGIPILQDVAAVDLSGSALVAAAEPKSPAPAPVGSARLPAPTPAPASGPAQAPAAAVPTSSSFTGHPLTLDLIDISLVDFFRLMAEEGGINVVMDPEIKGTLSIKVVKVPWDQIFEAALANNGLDKQIEGNLVRIARKTTLQEEAKQREALKKANLLAADIETRIKRLNYAKAVDFVGPLSEQKTVRGTVVVDERTNSLILTDIPSSLERMLQLIDTLDIPQPQVEIEARIVAATRDFARDIGVQFGFVQGNLQRVSVGGPNTFGTIGGTRPSATPTNTFSAGNNITGRGASQSSSSQSAGVSTGISSNNDGNFNVNLPAQKAFGGIGISVGNIFDTFLLDAAITAGETKGLAKLISQPKVTAQNNSPASITQGVRFPVQIIANNTVTVQFQNAALTLTVTPQITYEGNIVLDLKVENNTPDFAKSVNGIPSIRTSESSTRVLVTDGGTTVIGGILIDNETTQEDRVPGLASLPIIGNVFRRSLVSRSTQEVLFFITPRVIK